MRNYAQIRASAHQTEAMSVADEAGAQIAAVTQTTTVAAAGKTKNKKGVTLSLQEFNRGGVGWYHIITRVFIIQFTEIW